MLTASAAAHAFCFQPFTSITADWIPSHAAIKQCLLCTLRNPQSRGSARCGCKRKSVRRLGYSQPIDVKRFTEANHCSVSYLLEQSLCSAPIVLFPVSTGVQNNMLVVSNQGSDLYICYFGAFYTKFKKELTLRLFVLI